MNRDEFATKAALAAFGARMTATLYRAHRIQGAGIIAILTALRFLPIRPCARSTVSPEGNEAL